MASLRSLRKNIRFVCGELAAECLIARNYLEGVDAEEFGKIIVKVAHLQEEALQKLNISFDKGQKEFANAAEYAKAKTAYFKKAYNQLADDFNAKVKELVNEMNAAAHNQERAAAAKSAPAAK